MNAMAHRVHTVVFAVLLATTGLVAEEVADEVVALPQAHAHNDYEHRRPLLDALASGFCSVEADIHLVDGRLLVAHDREDVRPEHTLERLYLDPLRERVRAHGGRVYRFGPTFTLLIDIKTAGEPTYRVLHETLSEHREMLTTFSEKGRMEAKAVTVIISGNRPWAMIAAQPVRYAGVDGRLSDLETHKPPHLMPLVSDNWRNHFAWRGDGPFPEAERAKLHRWVEQAHQRGYRIRFWATPDTERVWRELRAANVDLINTDDLTGLKRFMLDQRSE